MKFFILNQYGEIIGQALHDQVVLSEGERLWEMAKGEPPVNLDRLKARKIEEIKAAVRQKLEEDAWRIERARERLELGAAGETPEQVLGQREAIRRYGNALEQRVVHCEDRDEIKRIIPDFAQLDSVTAHKITPLAFARRFSPTELLAIYAARDSQPQLAAYCDLVMMARDIDLTDPTVQEETRALEAAGILKEGRAAEILAFGEAHD